jgi:hypothetical protein
MTITIIPCTLTEAAERAPSNPAQWQSRPGREWQPVVGQAKLLWGAA